MRALVLAFFYAVALFLPAGAQEMGAEAAEPFLPAFRALTLWAATPAGVSLLGRGHPWAGLDLKDTATLTALAPMIRALRSAPADLSSRLESIASLPETEQRELLRTLHSAAYTASHPIDRAAGLPEADAAARSRAITARIADGAERLSADQAELKSFIDDFHKDLIKDRPDLFALKMKKAKQSEFTFYRAFPQLYYRQLKDRPEAGALAKTPRVLLSGDLHPENTELVPYKNGMVLQPNDFDDAGKAPVALEIARMLGGAGVLGKTAAERKALVLAAAEAYQESLSLRFRDWAKAAQEEKAVRKAATEDQDWARNAGRPLADKTLAQKLFAAARLDTRDWKVYDRAGAGLSSIGMRRYMFVNKEHGHSYELKELRPSALDSFTGGRMRNDPRAVKDAYEDLRKVPVEVRTLSFDGSDWYLRRREAFATPLALDRALSAARVIGGMAAQMHRQLADPADLAAALKTVSPGLILDSLVYMSRMRKALLALLKAGTWDPS